MNSIRFFFRRVRRAMPAPLKAGESGMAAVEFSLILPLLVVLWIGGVEMTQALSVDRRLNNLASAIGDLVARRKQVSEQQLSDILSIAPGAMYPYCGKGTGVDESAMDDCLSKGLELRLTALKIDDDENAIVQWSREAEGATGYTAGDNKKDLVPEDLRQVPDSQVIMAETSYTYTPAVGYQLTGGVGLEDRMFFIPRLTQYVQLCNAADECVPE